MLFCPIIWSTAVLFCQMGYCCSFKWSTAVLSREMVYCCPAISFILFSSFFLVGHMASGGKIDTLSTAVQKNSLINSSIFPALPPSLSFLCYYRTGVSTQNLWNEEWTPWSPLCKQRRQQQEGKKLNLSNPSFLVFLTSHFVCLFLCFPQKTKTKTKLYIILPSSFS